MKTPPKKVSPSAEPSPFGGGPAADNPVRSLILTGLKSVNIATTAEAKSIRDDLLARSRRGTRVDSAAGAERATALLKELKAFSRGIDATRREVKAPVSEIVTKIDGLAKELTAEVEAEAARISALLGAWQGEQDRMAEEKRRAAAAEADRIRQDELAEQDRLALETQRKMNRAQTPEAQEKIQDAAAASAIKLRSEAAAEAAQVRAAATTGYSKPKGAAIRREVQFEVEDVNALYAAMPALVILQPNREAIKAVLKTLPEGSRLTGVRHWWESKAVV